MDDDYGDIDDAAFAAIADATEKAHLASKTNTATATTAGSSKQPVVQPVPRKIQKATGPSSIVVNTRQKGNPLLPYIKNTPWEYGDIPADYLPNPRTAMLFLSLKYHRLHPEYIYTRIKFLGQAYTLRVVLVLVDTEQHSDPLKELTKAGIIHSLTIMLAWSPAEAGRYVELYKALENTPATMIKERQKEDYMGRVEDVITSVKGVNKTDALGLIMMFGSMRAAVNASEQQVELIPGWGEKKTRRWCTAVRENFRVGGALLKKRDEAESETIVPLNPMSDEERLALNRRLGIAGPARVKQNEAVETIELDEDEVQAMIEMEEEERRRKMPQDGNIDTASAAKQKAAPSTTTTTTTTTEDGVMAALAKLRKQ
ncbi:Excision repair cross-complementation group 1 [Orbilia oligospora]|uniref:Excision repair cross-complementation group 1 n=1 Tax=Orbilia oligospora TaxID=2813651 RepID=A0A7C8VF04_ORBOL|nr:Excision repair cross-complementation group 1 [Orbilia oligospora]